MIVRLNAKAKKDLKGLLETYLLGSGKDYYNDPDNKELVSLYEKLKKDLNEK